MSIEKILADIGLPKNKGLVYLSALGLGPSSVHQIAARAGLPRTTVYEILDGLLALGLVSFVNRGRTRIYSVESPEKLRLLLRQKERAVESILPQLASMISTKGTRPVVRFYEGVEGVKTVLEDTLTSEDTLLRGILSMDDLYKVPGRDYMEDYVARRIASGFNLNVIRSKVKEVEETWPTSTKEKRELRYAPEKMIFPMTVYLYDFRKIGLIGTERENFGMIVESEDLYQTLKNMFELLWSIAK